MINPAALAVSLWLNEYMWLNAVVALIIKTIVIRIGGVRLLEERAIPAVTGFCTGFGALFLVAALKTLIVEVLPLLIIYTEFCISYSE
jgi:predicted neutral ceramidase superfamily lipid hydrolase